jgi:hypothetical protein
MSSAIDNPASSEIDAVILFLHSKNTSAAEIHRELCTVYGLNVMPQGTVRCWCRMFKDGRTSEQMFTMKSEVVGRPSVVSDDLVESVDQKICERRRFTISEHTCEFP